MIPAECMISVHDNGPSAPPTVLHVYVDREAAHDVRLRIYAGRMWGRARIVGRDLVDLEQRWPVPGAAARLAECVTAWTDDDEVPAPPAMTPPPMPARALPASLAETPPEGVELPPTQPEKRGFFKRKRVPTDV